MIRVCGFPYGWRPSIYRRSRNYSPSHRSRRTSIQKQSSNGRHVHRRIWWIRPLQFYTKLYLQDDILVKVDRASMMHSLEVRAPFLDIELVNLVRRIPSAYKFRNGTTKYILKKALEDVLPREIYIVEKRLWGARGPWFRKTNWRLRTQHSLSLATCHRAETGRASLRPSG